MTIYQACSNFCMLVNLFRGPEHFEATEEDRCGNPRRKQSSKLENVVQNIWPDLLHSIYPHFIDTGGYYKNGPAKISAIITSQKCRNKDCSLCCRLIRVHCNRLDIILFRIHRPESVRVRLPYKLVIFRVIPGPCLVQEFCPLYFSTNFTWNIPFMTHENETVVESHSHSEP